MLVLMGVPLLLLAAHTSYSHTAVDGPEAATISHISELLNLEECRELYIRLAVPQKDAKHSSDKDLFPPSQGQDISNPDQCKNSLAHWLEIQRGTVDWDRLARALRQIGRPDISRELKKRLSRNPTLEPKWEEETNQTAAAAPETALLAEKKDPSQKSPHGPIQRYRTAFLKKRSWDWDTVFQEAFPFFHNVSLQQCLRPLAVMLIASLLAGLVVWLISVYYVVCWNLGQCLFASGEDNNYAYGFGYGTNPGRQNMNLTVIVNQPANEDYLDDQEDQLAHEDCLDDQEDQDSFEDISDEDLEFQ
ncbi:hypothetical protein lerEdw1_001580 [Lerista edwardsae]|nr:hypothetical protein lerEdw1_001580 [Lerista edwardsae]